MIFWPSFAMLALKVFEPRKRVHFHYLLFNIQQQFKHSEKKVSPSN
jgi:hypothetical protein